MAYPHSAATDDYNIQPHRGSSATVTGYPTARKFSIESANTFRQQYANQRFSVESSNTFRQCYRDPRFSIVSNSTLRPHQENVRFSADSTTILRPHYANPRLSSQSADAQLTNLLARLTGKSYEQMLDDLKEDDVTTDQSEKNDVVKRISEDLNRPSLADALEPRLGGALGPDHEFFKASGSTKPHRPHRDSAELVYLDRKSPVNDSDTEFERTLDGHDSAEPEEVSYWIPQATPDGKLFYLNTLTGKSTFEMPQLSTASHPTIIFFRTQLTRALEHALTAVKRDEAGEIREAIADYGKARKLLTQVIFQSRSNDDRNKLRQSRDTYATRIQELKGLQDIRRATEELKELVLVDEAFTEVPSSGIHPGNDEKLMFVDKAFTVVPSSGNDSRYDENEELAEDLEKFLLGESASAPEHALHKSKSLLLHSQTGE